MTVTGQLRWDEGPISVENQNARTELRYVLSSDDPENEDRNEAYNWLAANAPSRLYGLTLNRLSVNEQVMETPTERKWDAVAAYVLPESKKPKPVEVDETADPTAAQKTRLSVRSGSGQTLRRIYSREMVEQIDNNVLWALDPATHGRMINMKSSDSDDTTATLVAQGIDVPLGTVEMVVDTVRLNEDVQVNGYLVKVAQYAAENVINSAVYKGFPIGSLKLINFIASQRGGDEGSTALNTEPWDVTYTFQYAEEIDVSEIDYPPEFGNPGAEFTLSTQLGKLRGWQYLDVLYVNDEVTSSGGLKIVMPKAVRCAVHNMYKSINFANELKI